MTPLQFWLDKIISVERQTATKDSRGGETNGSWNPISAATTNIKASLYKHSEKPQHIATLFARPSWKGDFVCITDVACAAKPGDRVNHNGVYYQIHDTFDYGHSNLIQPVVYVIDCSLVRITSGNT